MQYFGERLKAARKIKGWSLQELANETRAVTKQALSKYEAGVMQPSRKILMIISDALDVKLSYFDNPPAFQLPAFEFRKNTLPVKQVESIREQVKQVLEHYLHAETILDIKPKFSNPVKSFSVPDETAAANVAKKLLNHWDLGRGALHNLSGLLEERGIRVIQVTSTEIFNGLSTYIGRIPLIVLHQDRPADVKRFAAMYELGQLLLNIPDDADRHKICKAFAGAMLLPEDTLVNLLGEKRQAIALGELICIKEQYGVPMQVIMQQAVFRGIIEQKMVHSFLRLVAGNKDETGLGNYTGNEKTYRFDRMICRLIVEEIIDINKASEITGLSAETLQRKVAVMEAVVAEEV